MKKAALKLATIMLAVALCLTAAPLSIAYGDVSWEPPGNFGEALEEYFAFDKTYEEYSVSLDRTFICTSSGGSPIKRDFAKDASVGTVANGETVFLSYSCLYNGEFWGLVDIDEQGERQPSGWVKINDFLVAYDSIAFMEDHPHELYSYEGDYSEFVQVDTALMWTWPGSGQYTASIEVLHEPDASGNQTAPFHFAYVYRDTDGREWGLELYVHASRLGPNDYWICISDPTNKNLPAPNGNKKPTVWESDTTHKDVASLGASNTLATLAPVLCLVSLVVVGTVLLIVVLWRKPKKTTI